MIRFNVIEATSPYLVEVPPAPVELGTFSKTDDVGDLSETARKIAIILASHALDIACVDLDNFQHPKSISIRGEISDDKLEVIKKQVAEETCFVVVDAREISWHPTITSLRFKKKPELEQVCERLSHEILWPRDRYKSYEQVHGVDFDPHTDINRPGCRGNVTGSITKG